MLRTIEEVKDDKAEEYGKSIDRSYVKDREHVTCNRNVKMINNKKLYEFV